MGVLENYKLFYGRPMCIFPFGISFFKTLRTDYLIDIHVGPRLDPKATLIQIRIIIKENSPIKICDMYSPN